MVTYSAALLAAKAYALRESLVEKAKAKGLMFPKVRSTVS